MTLLDHPILKYLRPYVSVDDNRDNVDVLQPPDDLRELALSAICNCCACGRRIHPFRARAKSGRSRVEGTEVERRLFYSGTCPAEVDPGCARSKAAREHKDLVRRALR